MTCSPLTFCTEVTVLGRCSWAGGSAGLDVKALGNVTAVKVVLGLKGEQQRDGRELMWFCCTGKGE